MEKIEVITYNRVNKLEKPDDEKGIQLDKDMIKQILLYLLSFMLGRASLLVSIAPFGVAFFSASLGKRNKYAAFWTGFFAITGSFSLGGLLFSLKYVLAVCAIIIADIIFNLGGRKPLVKALYSSLICVAAFMIYTYYNGMLTYDIITSIIEGALIFVLCYIFSIFLDSIDIKGSAVSFTSEQLISILITLSLVMSAFNHINLVGVSLQNVAAMLAIMLLAYHFGGTYAAASGAYLGLILNISDHVIPTAIGTWAFAGLTAGLFRSFKKIGIIFGFIGGWIIINGYTDFYNQIMYSGFDVIIGAGLFAIIPEKLISIWINVMKPVPNDKKNYPSTISARAVGDRLYDFSNAFDVLSDQFKSVNEDESSDNYSEKFTSIFESAAQNVCINTRCNFYEICFKRDFYSTYRMLFAAIDTAQSKGYIDRNMMNEKFRERCPKLDIFIKELNYAFKLFRLNMLWEKKLDETKRIMSKQLKEVAETMEHMSSYVNTKIEVQARQGEALMLELQKRKIKVKEASVYKDKEGVLCVEVITGGCMGRLKCINEITPIVEEVIGTKMVKTRDACMFNDNDGECCLCLMEKPEYTMRVARQSIAKHVGSVCGDNASNFIVNNRKQIMVLSDGMGTGIKAFNQSRASVDSIESLLMSGFEVESAARLVNSILLVGEGENSFATLDICAVNMYNGDIEFSKIGGAPTFIKRKNKVEYINSDTLPIGILDNVEVKLTRKHLEDGDMVIMITDGVIDNGDGMWLKKFVGELNTESADTAAKAIIEYASRNYEEELNDDMTVLVGIIKKEKINE